MHLVISQSTSVFNLRLFSAGTYNIVLCGQGVEAGLAAPAGRAGEGQLGVLRLPGHCSKHPARLQAGGHHRVHLHLSLLQPCTEQLHMGLASIHTGPGFLDFLECFSVKAVCWMPLKEKPQYILVHLVLVFFRI